MKSLPEDLLDQIELNCRRLYEGVVPSDADYRQIARDAASPQRAREEIDRLQEFLWHDRSSRTLLEIGSGYGVLPAVARAEFGIEAFGVEPSGQFSGSFECSREIIRLFDCPEDTVQLGTGENLPFANNTFDLVYSSNVLEHVSAPHRVVAEALRVLRPGGYLYFVVPNYGSWWEGHYGILWIPHLSKRLARLYVRLYRRDPSFIDTLQFITRGSLERIILRHAEEVTILDWGQDLWAERLRTLNFSQWACLGHLHSFATWLHRLGLVRITTWIGRRLHWETPLVLTLRKN